eukprot:RCo004609
MPVHVQRTKLGTVPMVDTAIEETLAQYKFYLAFETESCKDYVTEKFFRALYVGSVPVVMGAPNVWEFAPTNRSYIDVNDFDGPKALADYLVELDNDDEKYLQYLQWKSYKSVDRLNPKFVQLARFYDMPGSSFRGYSRSAEQVFCDLCRVLQVRPRRKPTFPLRCVPPRWTPEALSAQSP